jgi:hypothetical protein
MSQFPVESDEQLFQAVNYLLSGPSGLGQNFQGFSDYKGAYLTGTFRAPFTLPLTTTPVPSLYVAPLTITNITTPDNPGRYIYVTFSGWGGSQPPFSAGDTIKISGVANPAGSFFNDTYNRSVVSCTTTQVIIQLSKNYTMPTWISGGVIDKDLTNLATSTDCNGRVTVYGPTDRVFVTSQLNLNLSYTATIASEFDVRIQINRYRGTPTDTPGDNDYTFDLDTNPLVSEQFNHYSVTGNGSTGNQEYIFTTVLDQPSFGYYWYILDIVFSTLNYNLGGLLDRNMGSTDNYNISGEKAIQTATTTYSGITPTTSGSGTSAVIDVQLLVGSEANYDETNTRIIVDTAGSDYAVGDTLSIPGTSLGGTSPLNDMTLVITAIDPQPYPGDAQPNVATLGLRSFTTQVIKE